MYRPWKIDTLVPFCLKILSICLHMTTILKHFVRIFNDRILGQLLFCDRDPSRWFIGLSIFKKINVYWFGHILRKFLNWLMEKAMLICFLYVGTVFQLLRMRILANKFLYQGKTVKITINLKKRPVWNQHNEYVLVYRYYITIELTKHNKRAFPN